MAGLDLASDSVPADSAATAAVLTVVSAAMVADSIAALETLSMAAGSIVASALRSVTAASVRAILMLDLFTVAADTTVVVVAAVATKPTQAEL